MGQSLTAIYIHAIFGTKFRHPYIESSIEKNLHKYISGNMKKINSPVIRINSMPDHIHILFRMSKVDTISNIMESVKKNSSKWMKTQGYTSFKWQIGYAAFSVNQAGIKKVSDYIENQKKHHHRKSFIKEVEMYMDEYEVDQYSREFFWT